MVPGHQRPPDCCPLGLPCQAAREATQGSEREPEPGSPQPRFTLASLCPFGLRFPQLWNGRVSPPSQGWGGVRGDRGGGDLPFPPSPRPPSRSPLPRPAQSPSTPRRQRPGHREGARELRTCVRPAAWHEWNALALPRSCSFRRPHVSAQQEGPGCLSFPAILLAGEVAEQ